MATSANFIIQFGDSVPADGGNVYGGMSVEIDPIANENTNFVVGSTAYVRIISQGFQNSSTYEVLISGGTIERVMTGIPYVVEENLTFAYSSEASLKYLPVSPPLPTWEWIGNTPSGQILAQTENDRAFLRSSAGPIVAVAHMQYETLGDRWALTFNEEGPVVVVALREGKIASTTVNFSALDVILESVGPFAWEVVVKNFASGDPEAGVHLTIEGIAGEFVTDGNGRVFVGTLPAGTYNVQLWRDSPELIPSGQDSIGNDQFTIPSTRPPTDEEEVI